MLDNVSWEDGKELLGATFSSLLPPVSNLPGVIGILQQEAIGTIIEETIEIIPPNSNSKAENKENDKNLIESSEIKVESSNPTQTPHPLAPQTKENPIVSWY